MFVSKIVLMFCKSIIFNKCNYKVTDMQVNRIQIKKISIFLGCGKAEYFVVEPLIIVNQKTISYSQLNIQTVFARLLGPLSKWKEALKTQTDLGYNAFHFAPIQKLGKSGSLYSIKNQLKLSKEVRPGKNVIFLNKFKRN